MTLLQRTIIFGLACYKLFLYTYLRIDAIQKHADVFYNPTTMFLFFVQYFTFPVVICCVFVIFML